MLDKAMQWYSEMLAKESAAPDVVTYNIIIDGLCKVGRLTETKKIFADMQRSVLPNIRTYNTLINGFCKKGLLDDAMELYTEILNKDNVAPDIVTYNSIIDGLCKTGRFSEAENVKSVASML